MRVAVLNSDRAFTAEPAQSLLDAALSARCNLPHSCKGGNCGSCRARLLRGAIDYPAGAPLGLSQRETAEGYILLCQARARGDLLLELQEQRAADEITVRRLPCRVRRADRLSHDVARLSLQLPAAEPFNFLPGQYLDVLLSRGRRRSFSIASPPHDSRLLELHVRRVPGGEFTERLFREDMSGALLNIEAPLGQFHYREGAGPMLLLGGGTGIAPLLSILRHVIEQGIGRELRVYWGVRTEQDLYAHQTLLNLTQRAARMRYVAVLSAAAPAWAGRIGWVHRAALEDLPDLEPYQVYAAGPPAMIDAVRSELPARGVRSADIYVDSFDFAPDSPARQSSIADTKS